MTDIDTCSVAQRIGKHLRAHRSALMQESKMHDAIAAAFTDAGVRFVREHSLCATERLDFWLPDFAVAVEVKKSRAGLAQLEQIGRYLDHACVSSVLLIAMRIAPQVPAQFRGKPIWQIELWRYFL